MFVTSSSEYDVTFEDEYQRARRRRMLAAQVAAEQEPPKVSDALVHNRHLGTGISTNVAQGESPEPRGKDERPRETLIHAWDTTPIEFTRRLKRAEFKVRRKSSRLEMAVAFLKRELAAGPTSARVIYERGARVGLCERTTDRAKSEAQIRSKRLKTDRGMHWVWYLPGTEPFSLDDRVSDDGKLGAGGSTPEGNHRDERSS